MSNRALMVVAAVALAAMTTSVGATQPVSMTFEIDGYGMDELDQWGGWMKMSSPDFPQGQWDVTTSPLNWTTHTNGSSWWWEGTAPGTFNLEDDTYTYSLTGTCDLNLVVYAEDADYDSILNGSAHSVAFSGAITAGTLPGKPPIIGGSATLPATSISSLGLWNLGDGYVPRASFGSGWTPLNGSEITAEAQPTPEPCTLVLLLAGGAIAGGLRRRSGRA